MLRTKESGDPLCQCLHPKSAHVEGRCDTEVSDYGTLDCQCQGFAPICSLDDPNKGLSREFNESILNGTCHP